MDITGEDIRLGRAVVGKSVSELADLADVSAMTISRVEAGLVVRKATLMRVGGALEQQGVTFNGRGVTYRDMDVPRLSYIGRMTGARLARARERLTWTTSQLASASGVAVDTIARLEKRAGLGQVRAVTLVSLVGALRAGGYFWGENATMDRKA